MISNRLAAAALAAFAAAVAIPVALAQLDFAGVLPDVDSGDTPAAVLVLAGISGVLTLGIVCLALAGAALALAEAPSASTLLSVAAVAGFVSATIFWIPAGVCLGAAVALLGRTEHEQATAASVPDPAR